jgi:predicted O-linked N-acetylglucosamine transferase (SPINDLY family)
MQRHPGSDARELLEESRRWNLQHGEPLRKFIQPHANDRTPDRRLRIGYVSPDFGDHPVGRFLLPLLEQHDRSQLEIFCYSNSPANDRLTARLRAGADQWRNIMGLSDESVAGQIRGDAIDILVDLSGHTSGNRLLVFARKPAPVQVSYLGYPATSGLSAIDYRLTDPLSDPPGATDPFHVETLYRLPHTNWCFEPQASPVLTAPPSTRTGHLTFGSFSNFAKITPPLLQLWRRILDAVSNSRMVLKNSSLQPASVRERIRIHLNAQGINDRVDLLGPQPDYANHLNQYQQMDIALDTFPYNGTTTLCDALWMGVPAITLSGQSHVSRVGLSLLTNIGLPELIAATPDEYVDIAVDLAKDPHRLATLRSTLRDRMTKSPLMDAPKFARDVEAAYRHMWRNWCNS